jgi:DNA helicase-2/ATP-dependent DNA helicase PcrA
MDDLPADEITWRINNTRTGSVVAAAGCGKTEQIALAVAALSATESGTARPLILTHTFAGVDVIRKRLSKMKVSAKSYQLDTIASWSLRFATAYPKTSKISSPSPVTNDDWDELYPVATRLVASGTVDDVLSASYSRIFVDEYQDCVADQHTLITSLNRVLPVCIFGDPLQSIFKFAGAIDWDSDIEPYFPQLLKLTKPWRWSKEGANSALGIKLAELRKSIEAGTALDFTNDRDGISRLSLPIDPRFRSTAIETLCRETMELEGTLLVVADSQSDNRRAKMIERLAKQKFSALEPLASKTLTKHAKAIEEATDGKRLEATLAFLKACMGGVTKEFSDGVASKHKGGKAKRLKYGGLLDVGDRVDRADGFREVLPLVEGFMDRDDTYPYRRELLSAIISGLRTVDAEGGSLIDAVTDFQTRSRHLGRHIPRRSIGSTLLVKGLEVDHVIIVEYPKMTGEDWYVALTRAVKSVIILSRSAVISTGIE